MTLSRPNDFDAEELPLHNKKRGLDDFRRNKLAEHQLGSTKFSGVLRSSVSLEEPRVSCKFTSTNEAIQFLTAIAVKFNSGLKKVQIKVVLEDAALLANHQH